VRGHTDALPHDATAIGKRVPKGSERLKEQRFPGATGDKFFTGKHHKGDVGSNI
jgi:hypothetical protein